ncbi:hypothetical protein CMI41_04375 [Candidatus Pacearchaeota archaeon]|nr:hypothetical protein [Candidatus Pacearchaeota archaeon]|tara:strand:- start:487 stop:672 length:186 start_codon:yes stop_codon:yes gene_type:complete
MTGGLPTPESVRMASGQLAELLEFFVETEDTTYRLKSGDDTKGIMIHSPYVINQAPVGRNN